MRDLNSVFKKPVAMAVLKEVMRTPGQYVSEISIKLKKPQPVITRSLKQLGKCDLIRTELVQRKGKIVKLVFPSLRGLFENISETTKKKLDDKDLAAIDKHLLNPKISRIILGSFIDYEGADLTTSILSNTVIVSPKMRSKINSDRELQKTNREFMRAMQKLGLAPKI